MKLSKDIQKLFEVIDNEWHCQQELFPGCNVELNLRGRDICLILEAVSCLREQYLEEEYLHNLTGDEHEQ